MPCTTGKRIKAWRSTAGQQKLRSAIVYLYREKERNLSAAVEAKLKRVRISINCLKCGYANLNFVI